MVSVLGHAALLLILAAAAYAQSADSCVGRCGDSPSNSHSCQCNDHCERFQDCCVDYEQACFGGGEGEITDAELRRLGDDLWSADSERFLSSELTLNDQTMRRPNRFQTKLFAHVDEEKLSQPSYRLFIDLLDNYNAFNGQEEEVLTSTEQQETDRFLDHVVSSEVMTIVAEFLTTKGKIQPGSMKEVLYGLWFEFYGRSSSMNFADSSGFEHVFVGEKKSTKVNGFHSWVQMYLLERSNNLVYTGYNAKSEPDLMDNRLTWDGLSKQRASMFVGTSPEFDMALYTLCMLARPGSSCETSIQGNTVSIQTYDVSHISGLQVASAFPMVRNSRFYSDITLQ